jgi:hypothetical protein
MFHFQALDPGSRRFELGFDRVDLHCPTMALEFSAAAITAAAAVSSAEGLTLVHLFSST